MSGTSGGGRIVGTGSSSTEGIKGLFCGILFGVTSPLVGHPIDTWKTMLQTTNTSERPLTVLKSVFRSDGGGFRRLYRGLVPPLCGSSIFRATQFGVYSASYGALRDYPVLCAGDSLFGLQPRVFIAAFLSTTARAIIETPLEVLKVRRQTMQNWTVSTPNATVSFPVWLGHEIRSAYVGFGLTWSRLFVALGSFFVLIDVGERWFPSLLATPFVGAALKGGVAATFGWLLAWPLEVLKNSVQAALPMPGLRNNASILERARYIVATRGGVLALYRGLGPGLLRSLVANGAAMAAFQTCQDCFPSAI